jgi:predicted glycosyltransferase
MKKTKGYENSVPRVILLLKKKGIVVNDNQHSVVVEVTKNYEVRVPPKSIYVGQGKEVGHGTLGKLDFMKNYQGYTVFGFSDMR